MKWMSVNVMLLCCVLVQAEYVGYKYNGIYKDICMDDGFYYNDANSFIVCSNGNMYEQPCGPGSQNSHYNDYVMGGAYGYRDFCDVNLADVEYISKYSQHDGYIPNTNYQDLQRSKADDLIQERLVYDVSKGYRPETKVSKEPNIDLPLHKTPEYEPKKGDDEYLRKLESPELKQSYGSPEVEILKYEHPMDRYDSTKKAYDPVPTYSPTRNVYNIKSTHTTKVKAYEPEPTFSPPKKTFSPESNNNHPKRVVVSTHSPPMKAYEPEPIYNTPKAYDPMSTYSPPKEGYESKHTYNTAKAYDPMSTYSPAKKGYENRSDYMPSVHTYELKSTADSPKAYNPLMKSYDPQPTYEQDPRVKAYVLNEHKLYVTPVKGESATMEEIAEMPVAQRRAYVPYTSKKLTQKGNKSIGRRYLSMLPRKHVMEIVY